MENGILRKTECFANPCSNLLIKCADERSPTVLIKFRLNKMMNRLTAYAKGLNPDDSEELMGSKHYMTAFRVNNKFFKVRIFAMVPLRDGLG